MDAMVAVGHSLTTSTRLHDRLMDVSDSAPLFHVDGGVMSSRPARARRWVCADFRGVILARPPQPNRHIDRRRCYVSLLSSQPDLLMEAASFVRQRCDGGSLVPTMAVRPPH